MVSEPIATITSVDGSVGTRPGGQVYHGTLLTEITFLRPPDREEFLSLMPCLVSTGRWRMQEGPWRPASEFHTLG